MAEKKDQMHDPGPDQPGPLSKHPNEAPAQPFSTSTAEPESPEERVPPPSSGLASAPKSEKPTVFQSYDPSTRTGSIGLAFTSDAVMNANLQRIDAAFAEIGERLGLLENPDPPAEDEPQEEEQS